MTQFLSATLARCQRAALPVLTVALLAGWGAAASPALAQTEGVLRYAIWSNPNGTFHPTIYFSQYDRLVVLNIYGRLFTLDEKQNPVPSLAVSYEFVDDANSLVVKLRDDVKWHDGEPFTAEDVAFTYTSEAKPDYPRERRPFTSYLKGFEAYSTGAATEFEGIEVLDAHTVKFNFNAPYPAAFSHFADRPVVAKHIWEDVPVATWNEATELLRNPVGTGPFKFKEFLPDQYVTLVRNEDYFEGAPEIETLIFKVSNSQTAQTELLNNELDIVEISSWNQSDIQVYENNNIRIDEQPGVAAQYMTMDSRDPRLSDKRVRQAIVHAINRPAMVTSLLAGHGQVFNTNAPPSSPYYPEGLNDYPYDPAKASALLAEAGWTDSDGDGVLDKDGEKFTFTLHVPTGNRTRELTGPIIQQNLRQVGIEVELIPGDFNSTLAILQDRQTEFDGMLMGSTFRPGQYGDNLWWERYENEDLSAVLRKFNSVVDEAGRAPLIEEWLRTVNDEAIRVWLYIPNVGYAMGPRVTHYTAFPNEPFANVQTWTVAD